MATAFVAGATGYTGREVVRALVMRGVDTVAHVRPDSAKLASLQRELGAEGARVDATPWDEAALTETLRHERPELVFALLGTTRARVRDARGKTGQATESYDAVDYGLTSLLLRAALASGSRPRFVYLSAVGVDSGTGAYFAARRKAEAEVRASGLPFVIARPSFITGPDRAERRTGERVAATVVDGLLSGLAGLGAPGLRDRYSSMTARELAAGLVHLALSSATEPGCTAEPERLRRAAAERI